MSKNHMILALTFIMVIIITPASNSSDAKVTLTVNHNQNIWIAQTSQPLTFIQVVDNLDLKKHTKFHVKEYMRMNRGMEVQSSGKVVDVIGGRGKVRILVANKNRRTIKGFNIVLTMYSDIDKASRLRKDQYVRFRGYLHNYKAGRHGAIIIYLREAQLL